MRLTPRHGLDGAAWVLLALGDELEALVGVLAPVEAEGTQH